LERRKESDLLRVITVSQIVVILFLNEIIEKEKGSNTIVTILDQEDYDENRQKTMINQSMDAYMKVIQSSVENYKREQEKKEMEREKKESERSDAIIELLNKQLNQKQALHQLLVNQNNNILYCMTGASHFGQSKGIS